jgi:hypothetical protein
MGDKGQSSTLPTVKNLAGLAIVLEAIEEPPTFARIGADRWTNTKVVIKGADPCASVVRIRSTNLSGLPSIVVVLRKRV